METEAFALTPIDHATETTITAFHICPTVIPDTRQARAEAILLCLECVDKDATLSLQTLTDWMAASEHAVLLHVEANGETNGETICKIRLVP